MQANEEREKKARGRERENLLEEENQREQQTHEQSQGREGKRGSEEREGEKFCGAKYPRGYLMVG